MTSTWGRRESAWWCVVRVGRVGRGERVGAGPLGSTNPLCMPPKFSVGEMDWGAAPRDRRAVAHVNTPWPGGRPALLPPP